MMNNEQYAVQGNSGSHTLNRPYDGTNAAMSAPPVGIGNYAAELQGAISELSERFDHLEKTLAPVTVPEAPAVKNPNMQAPGPSQSRSHVADSVIGARCRIDALTRRVEHLIGRLEL